MENISEMYVVCASSHSTTLLGSPSYGEGGYIRVYRAEDESEVCGIQLNPQDNDACEGDHKPRKVCGTCGILSGSSYLRDVQLAL